MFAFRLASNRNTKAFFVYIGSAKLFISYETVIGLERPDGGYFCTSLWSRTTGRHANEMGVDRKNWKKVTSDEMYDLIAEQISRDALERIKDKFVP